MTDAQYRFVSVLRLIVILITVIVLKDLMVILEYHFSPFVFSQA